MHSLKKTIFYIITNLVSDLIIQLTYNNYFCQGSNEGLLTAMILIDLQEAFDIRNHPFLLKKPKAMGFFSEGCLPWFQSYLSETIFLKVQKTNFLTMEGYCVVFHRVRS